MAKYRREPLTEERLKNIGESYRFMYVLARLLDYEYLQWKDTDFKNPLVHQQIGNIKNGVDYILKKYQLVLGETEEDNVLEMIHYLSEIMKEALSEKNEQQVDGPTD